VLGERGGALAPVRHHDDAGTRRMPDAQSPAAGSGAPQPVAGGQARDAAVAESKADAEPAQQPSIAIRASAGCNRGSPATSPMSFLLDVPAAYDSARPYPLVLAFRGMNQSAEQLRAQVDLEQVTGDSVLRVYVNPQGNAAIWDFQRDVPPVDMLLSDIGASYCIDLDRIFAIGDGAGALLANLLGCTRGDKFRGIALFASSPPPPGPCIGSVAVWLQQQSDADPMLVSAGLANRNFWVEQNGCELASPEHLSSAWCFAYPGCVTELPVSYCEHLGDALPASAVSDAWGFFSAL
jgi:poly(3-hydroxybutyrate) depolymerase